VRKKAPQRRTGGRSARVVQAVLEATLEELGRVGYAALTFEGIAVRAQVNRTTIYRRWPTKFALVHAAMVATKDSDEPPDTGSVRGDLLALAKRRLETMSLPRTRALAAAMISEAPDSELVQGAQAFREKARAMVAEVVERAIVRGELPPRTDPDLIQQPLFSVLFSGVLLRRELPSEPFILRLIDALLVGAAHDARISPPKQKI